MGPTGCRRINLEEIRLEGLWTGATALATRITKQHSHIGRFSLTRYGRTVYYQDIGILKRTSTKYVLILVEVSRHAMRVSG